ncbi:hypothetical protein AAH991_38505 [Microbispora sp. ZYX-F-249]|uniref:HTH cro/C1-type domain-containing protein n=1 Tax=Microbispora maris TaxID=3144104 RepID=A0ABV0B0N4_9ACTN
MSTTAAEISRQTGVPPSTVAKVLAYERSVQPDFLRKLGEASGIPVTRLFMEMGWLPESEVMNVLGASQHLTAALRDLARLRPYLEQVATPPLPAPLAAAHALLGDPVSAERFEVRLDQIVCGGRYRTPAITVAEFSLKDGAHPLPLHAARRLAAESGVRLSAEEEARNDPAFWSVRLELMARTRRVLDDGQEATWQGGPDHRTWEPVARAWPAHLLVQDAVGGRQRAASVAPRSLDRPCSLVVVGGRHGTGLAAPLLAEALGWQFVLIRGDVEVAPDGRVVPIPQDSAAGRIRAWISAAERIEEAAGAGRPWQAVILVRPAAFDGRERHPHLEARAFDLLARTRARVIYARVPDAYLSWWGRRIEGDHLPGRYDGERWARRTRGLYERLEGVLSRRTAGKDLLLHVPDPADGFAPHHPAIPDEVIDWSARVAWAAFNWVGRELGGDGDIRTGRLAQWAALLREDLRQGVPDLDL